ncbi:MAG: diguanylate cyclase [Burkholderiaceae bacterium]|jgi:diguanylate cyclase (GGDEF)-like protein
MTDPDKGTDVQRREIDDDTPARTPTRDLAFATNLVEFLVVPTFVLDRDGKVLIWNRACERLTGLLAKEVLGTREHWRGFYAQPRPCLCDLILYQRMNEFEQLYDSRAESQDEAFGAHAQNWCVMPRLGTELYLAIDAGPIYDATGNLVAVVETLRDMTAQKVAQTELARLASHDWLTGLVNRRGFDERLLAEWKRAGRDRCHLALLMIDVDFFKAFNDALGHVAGDDCLRIIALALRQSVTRPTDVVARFGGEEFAVILPATDLQGAKNVAERIRRAVEASVFAEASDARSISVTVTVSVGVAAQIPDRGAMADELVSRADRALYRAKHAGRNRVASQDPDAENMSQG